MPNIPFGYGLVMTDADEMYFARLFADAGRNSRMEVVYYLIPDGSYPDSEIERRRFNKYICLRSWCEKKFFFWENRNKSMIDRGLFKAKKLELARKTKRKIAATQDAWSALVAIKPTSKVKKSKARQQLLDALNELNADDRLTTVADIFNVDVDTLLDAAESQAA